MYVYMLHMYAYKHVYKTCISVYGNVPSIRDMENMIKCILRVLRGNTIDTIYAMSMYMTK